MNDVNDFCYYVRIPVRPMDIATLHEVAGLLMSGGEETLTLPIEDSELATMVESMMATMEISPERKDAWYARSIELWDEVERLRELIEHGQTEGLDPVAVKDTFRAWVAQQRALVAEWQRQHPQ